MLSGLEADGFLLVDISSSRSLRAKLFLHFASSNENMDDYYRLNFEELSEKTLYLYDKCENLLGD